MLVYLMGLTDIFAAIMLVTGFRPSVVLTYTIAMLALKGASSFWGRFNPLLYVLGTADLIAIVLLWNGMVLGHIGTAVLVVMLFKGFISFWELKLLRETTLNLAYILYKILKFGTKNISESNWKEKAANYLWFGSTKINNSRFTTPEVNYPKKEYNHFSFRN